MSVLANTTRLCSRVAKFLVMTLLSHQCAVMDPQLCCMVLVFLNSSIQYWVTTVTPLKVTRALRRAHDI